MSYVKLDCGILHSSLWGDMEARSLFITTLLMAMPKEISEPAAQIEIRSLELTGWNVPPGWYGFIAASSVGIIRLAGLEREAGLSALERLGSPEIESRSQEYDGRRLIRINGGFLSLNYFKYREKDHTAGERQQRYRDKKKNPTAALAGPSRNGVTSRLVTHADADADANAVERTLETQTPIPVPENPPVIPQDDPSRWAYERAAPWCSGLIADGCKIGANNWPTWKALIAKHTSPVVRAAIQAADPEERWPDKIEKAISSRGSQVESLNEKIAKRSHKIT
jgi:hypothetical protein